MTELKIDTGGWVVVCDGAKALVLENAGNRMHPNLHTRQVFEQPGLSDRELSADRPGRAFNSVGSARSAVEQVDRHVQDEQRFLTQIAAHLDKAVLAGDTPSLIVVAPPRAIGNYGDEVDNFMWPRHSGDFTFLRAYVGKDGKPTRVGFKVEDGKKVRFAKTTGDVI